MKSKTFSSPLFFLLLLVIFSIICSTYAYFTANDSTENVYTFGNINLILDESKVDEFGSAYVPEERVKYNHYSLIPGLSYNVDSEVHVVAGSVDCYVFLTVDNGIAAIESSSENYKTILEQMYDNHWTELKDGTMEISYNGLPVYIYEGISNEGSSRKNVIVQSEVNNIDLPIFSTFTLEKENIVQGPKPNDYSGSNLYFDEYANAKITINAYAIQADGFENALDAWTSTNPSFY